MKSLHNFFIRIALISSLIMLIFFSNSELLGKSKSRVSLGVIYDGPNSQEVGFLTDLKKELNNLLGSRYSIELSEQNIHSVDWSFKKLDRHYQSLIENSKIDMVLVLGFFSATAIIKQKRYPKPVIAAGIIDPELQHIRLTKNNTSGIHNLNYIYSPRSILNNLKLYHSVIPFKRLGILFDEEIFKRYPRKPEEIISKKLKKQVSIKLLPIDEGPNQQFIKDLENIDAVFIGYLGRYEAQAKENYIKALNKQKIPTFGLFDTDAKRGILAVNSAEINIPKIVRRIALNVELILSGVNPSKLPVLIALDQKLTLNLETARKINFSPKFSLLTQAELINEYPREAGRMLDLQTVFQQAINQNLDIQIEQLTVESQAKEVNLAKSKLFPSLSLSATGVVIDEDRAESSLGTVAEQTTYGTLSLNQLIYSDSVIGNIVVEKEKLLASEYGRESVKLDIMLAAGKAYFNILKAKSLFKLRKDNLARVKKNLKLAQQRHKVGYSSVADVYRWESQLAIDTGNVMEARKQVQLAKLQLNQILNHPLNRSFGVKDITINDSAFGLLTELGAINYFDNPRSIEILTEFLNKIAVEKSPEIHQLDSSLMSLNRTLTSLKRQHYLPTVSLNGEVKQTFSESGAGSEDVSFFGNELSSSDDTDWNIALNFSLPLSKGGETIYRTQQTEIEIAKLAGQKKLLVTQINQNLHVKLLDLSQSAADLELYQKAADLAEKSYQIVEDSYAKGAVSIVELTDAQNSVLNANIAVTNSIYDFIIDSLKTERAISVFVILKSQEEKKALIESYKTYHDNKVKS